MNMEGGNYKEIAGDHPEHFAQGHEFHDSPDLEIDLPAQEAEKPLMSRRAAIGLGLGAAGGAIATFFGIERKIEKNIQKDLEEREKKGNPPTQKSEHTDELPEGPSDKIH